MATSENLIEKFYNAFQRLDAETMVSCYHDDIRFEDPAFGVLNGVQAKNMWRMLCNSQKGKDFKVKVSSIAYNDVTGKATWEAFYTFSKTERKVHNLIEANFELQDGKIIVHTDHFNLYRWSRQAFGITGLLMGWTSFFRKKLQQQTRQLLFKFEQNRAQN
jgi:limonene-1,2-epoxide hydrolase